MPAERAQPIVRHEGGAHRAGDQDDHVSRLVGELLARFLQALRHHHRIADHRVVDAARAADVADHDPPEVDADPHADLRPAARLLGAVEGAHAGGDGERRPAGPVRLIGNPVRRAPERHDGIAHVLVDDAALGLDAVGHHGEVPVEELGGGVRGHRLGQPAEVDEVGEQHRDLAVARLERVLALQSDQAAHQGPRHVALEPAQALQHGVEGGGGLVQFVEEAAGNRIHRRQVEVVDLFRSLGEAPHRAGDLPADVAGGDRREQRDRETDDDRPFQAQRLGEQVAGLEVGADQQGPVGVTVERAVEHDEALVGEAHEADARSGDDPLLQARLGGRLPHRGDHRVAERPLLGKRLQAGAAVVAEGHQRMGEHPVPAVEDEGVGAELALQIGDELGQPGGRDQGRDSA